MSPAIIASIVAEASAYGRGERKGKLTWQKLSDFSGFSKISLWKKAEIKAAVTGAVRAQRSDATREMKEPKARDERIADLCDTIKQLREKIRLYDERWTLHTQNIHRLGIDPEELLRPLPPIDRRVVRAPVKRRRAGW